MPKQNESITINPIINKKMHALAKKQKRSFSQMMEIAAEAYLKSIKK
jgi:hypothetical protein